MLTRRSPFLARLRSAVDRTPRFHFDKHCRPSLPRSPFRRRTFSTTSVKLAYITPVYSLESVPTKAVLYDFHFDNRRSPLFARVRSAEACSSRLSFCLYETTKIHRCSRATVPPKGVLLDLGFVGLRQPPSTLTSWTPFLRKQFATTSIVLAQPNHRSQFTRSIPFRERMSFKNSVLTTGARRLSLAPVTPMTVP